MVGGISETTSSSQVHNQQGERINAETLIEVEVAVECSLRLHCAHADLLAAACAAFGPKATIQHIFLVKPSPERRVLPGALNANGIRRWAAACSKNDLYEMIEMLVDVVVQQEQEQEVGVEKHINDDGGSDVRGARKRPNEESDHSARQHKRLSQSRDGGGETPARDVVGATADGATDSATSDSAQTAPSKRSMPEDHLDDEHDPKRVRGDSSMPSVPLSDESPASDKPTIFDVETNLHHRQPQSERSLTSSSPRRLLRCRCPSVRISRPSPTTQSSFSADCAVTHSPLDEILGDRLSSSAPLSHIVAPSTRRWVLLVTKHR